ncbi:S41 family peptidase [Martelella mediterranea]|uniref:Carboxyl-terminal processing protease n=1 Tax=Martelella mediterranea TaxID=293089 RepID=A0A4R3NJQ0_9HYPH|nr:S41 family peptidase [Martelella mediterranea]TCT35347.1 carboxyl-terminal processing protease [Martelella mediterranea]
MIRRATLLLAGVVIGASATGFLVSSDIPARAASDDSTYREMSLFGDVFERVRSQYVTPPDEEKMIQDAINGMLKGLDPHSSYMTAEESMEMRDESKGEFGGLGIEVTMEDEAVKVVAPIDDTPASEAGVLAGDKIIEIDGESVRGMTLNDAVDRMRGEVGEPIDITILRDGVTKPIEMTIKRGIIQVQSVKWRVENDDIGYIRLTTFMNEKLDESLEEAIKEIQAQVPEDKLKGYVLDLRLNPGGFLNQAVSVSDTFLDEGEVVSTRGRDERETRRFSAGPGDLTNGKPIVVLVNGGSASASEIVAGALHDLKRATLVGTRTFGKGSVQTIVPLGDQGSLRLTTALYYTPSGTSIQGTGIEPDIIVEQKLPEDLEGLIRPEGESALRGHIEGDQETDEGSGSVAYVPREPEDDVQLQYAIGLLEGTEKNDAFPADPRKAVEELQAKAHDQQAAKQPEKAMEDAN